MDARKTAHLDRIKSINPCYEESVKSLKCQELDGIGACQKEISEYTFCRQFWQQVYNLRRLHGLRPFLPELDDRQRIKEVFRQTKRFEHPKTQQAVLFEENAAKRT